MLTILGNLILQARRRSYTPHSGVKLTPDRSLLLILILSPTIRRFTCGESRLLPIPVRDLVGSSSFPSSCCINTPRSNHNAPKDQFCLQAPQRFWTVFFLLVFGLQFTVLYAHASPLVLGGSQNTSLRNVSLPILAIRHPTLELSLDPPGAQGDRGGRVGRSTLRIISSTNGTVLRLYTERTDFTRAYLTFSEDGQVQLTPNRTAKESKWCHYLFFWGGGETNHCWTVSPFYRKF
ncbi:unnamed protein product [Dibothriocephalus latus]|uniref:Uncharacterized protein n=1 Tax=Dibothriocephalus latus TaxID=60516 RepID=A0A3P7NJS9_DIBLA|nr:unnamed protein product [Dibothriocephalus latus]